MKIAYVMFSIYPCTFTQKGFQNSIKTKIWYSKWANKWWIIHYDTEISSIEALFSVICYTIFEGRCLHYDCTALSHLLELVHDDNKTQAFATISDAEEISLTALDLTGR